MNNKLKVAVLDNYTPNFQEYNSFIDIIYFPKFAKMKEFMAKDDEPNAVVGILDSSWKNLKIENGNFIISSDVKEIKKQLLKIYYQKIDNQKRMPNNRLEVLRKFKGITKPNIEISEDEWYLQ
ncbi:MAG: hypothetical protein OHK0057_01150 [Thermoflexibacter sp.]